MFKKKLRKNVPGAGYHNSENFKFFKGSTPKNPLEGHSAFYTTKALIKFSHLLSSDQLIYLLHSLKTNLEKLMARIVKKIVTGRHDI